MECHVVIPVPLAEKSHAELVSIVEMMSEDIRWYVGERNRLLAELDVRPPQSLELAHNDVIVTPYSPVEREEPVN